ncbi:RDD family protein [Lysobacter arvi]|uniref:RDD family protein n=1 Tax=Lysobacter arvi TaxID=3038776 RepID=A0ABU1CIL7_9GAMM|nr:RDD family protein [Lysobacter arvi]MDR0184791.1 RDD family protein [Lysobacter arvi]
MEGFEYRNPYAAPTAQVVVAPPDHDAAMEPADRGRRLLAYLIDFGIYLAAMLPAIVGLLRFRPERGIGALGGSLLMFSLVCLIALFVYWCVLMHRDGQSIGKRVMGMRIVRTDGSRAGLGRMIVLRYFVPGLIGAIPYVGWVFSLANPLWIFGEERRCLHDLICDTMVVNV